jgi:hypothetical protein
LIFGVLFIAIVLIFPGGLVQALLQVGNGVRRRIARRPRATT